MNADLLPKVEVLAVPAFRDNYLWLIHQGRHAVVVDPGDAGPIEAALLRHQLTLDAIVLTHHHQDHTGGVAELVRTRHQLPVYGPRRESIAHVNQLLDEGDQLDFENIELHLEVIDVPGHTRGHIAYFSQNGKQPLLFCGDTLFAGGCGRLFEGTPQQMHSSLSKLAALPDQTLVYCAHEYTLSNLRFALAVEPHNAALIARIETAQVLRQNGQATVPSTILLEQQTNPFLRTELPTVRHAADTVEPGAGTSALASFAAIRAWKDRFQ
jgi:hydroxyacylglutathione hydrolase